MTLHRLKIFAAIAEYKSITLAAQKLHMTQPAVSIQLKQLEMHHGLALIEILGKKVYLTEAGEKLLLAYQTMKEQLNYIDMEISQLKGCVRGKLRIATVSTAKYIIPKLLGKFHSNYPQVSIQLKVSNRNEILCRLQENSDDLVILSQLPKKLSIVAEQFLEDTLVVAAPTNHHLARKKNIDFKILASEPFIMREQGSGTRMVMERLFQKYRLDPNIIMELGSSSAIKQAIMAGFGLSIISKMSIENELLLKKITILNVKHFPIKHPWYIVYPKGKLLSPTAHNFFTFLKKHM